MSVHEYATLNNQWSLAALFQDKWSLPTTFSDFSVRQLLKCV